MTKIQKIIIATCLSFVIVISLLPDVVISTALKTMPSINMKISVLEESNEESIGKETFIWGYGVGNVTSGVNESFLQRIDSEGFQFIPKNPWVKNFIHSNSVGSSIVLNLKQAPNVWIGVLKRPDASKIIIEYDGISKVFDLYSKEHLSAEYYINPFMGDNLLAWVISILAFHCIYIIIVFLLIAILYTLFKRIKTDYFYLPNRFIPTFFIFFSVQLLFYVILQHYDQIYLTFGDSSWYWEVGKLAGVIDGDFSLKNYSSENFVVRSYLLPIIIYFIRWATNFNLLFSKIVYLIFSSGIASFFISFTMPKLYELLTGNKSINMQVYCFGVITLFFWWSFIYNPIVDFYASVFYFNAAVFLLMNLKGNQTDDNGKLLWGNRLLTSFISGGFLAAAALMRSNYKLVVYFIVVLLFLICMINLFSGRKSIFTYIKGKVLFFKNFNFLYFGVMLTGIFIVCLPEFIINIHRGVFSFFEYDKVGVYSSPMQTLATQLISESFKYSSGWPFVMENFVGTELLQDAAYAYVDINNLSILDCLVIYISYPLNTLAMFFGRLFLLIDIKTNILYPLTDKQLEPKMIISVINYAIYSIAFLCILIKNIRIYLFSRITTIFMIITFVFIGLPQVFFHVEWRFFLSVYILIYYIVAYLFIGELTDKNTQIFINKNQFHFIIKLFFLIVSIMSVSVILSAASKW